MFNKSWFFITANRVFWWDHQSSFYAINIFFITSYIFICYQNFWLLFHIFMFFLHLIYRRKFFESIKALDIKTSSLLNLVFASNTILLCLFFFFLIIDLYFLITVVIAQFFNSTAEFVMSAGIPIKKKQKLKHIQYL